jgi:YD repeat-containing protein
MAVFEPGRGIRNYDLGVPFTQAMDNSGTNNATIYIGKTKPGNAKTTAKWQIQKLTYDANGLVSDIQWPNGDNSFSYVWNDRASYSFS